MLLLYGAKSEGALWGRPSHLRLPFGSPPRKDQSRLLRHTVHSLERILLLRFSGTQQPRALGPHQRRQNPRPSLFRRRGRKQRDRE